MQGVSGRCDHSAHLKLARGKIRRPRSSVIEQSELAHSWRESCILYPNSPNRSLQCLMLPEINDGVLL